MNKQQQINKNLELSEKLADCMVKNQQLLSSLPQKASYVVFSLTDKKLNRLNNQLIKGLLKEGKKVIRAEETIDRNRPWKLIPVST